MACAPLDQPATMLKKNTTKLPHLLSNLQLIFANKVALQLKMDTSTTRVSQQHIEIATTSEISVEWNEGSNNKIAKNGQEDDGRWMKK